MSATTYPIGTRLLLRTSGDYGYDGDLDAAFIEITPELRTWAGTLKHAWWAAYGVLPETSWLHTGLEIVLDSFPAFISQDDADLDHLFLDLEDDDQTTLCKDDESPSMVQDVEGPEVHVTYEGIYWTARPRHSDVGVETALITWESLGLSKPEIKP